jgi:molecular chaperone DnaK (HSP70)
MMIVDKLTYQIMEESYAIRDEEKERMSKVIGIDLGTTNSSARLFVRAKLTMIISF